MTECLPNLPRFIIEREDGSWQGANHPDGPWRPIPAPQSGLPWPADGPAVPENREPASVVEEPSDEDLREIWEIGHLPTDEELANDDGEQDLQFLFTSAYYRWLEENPEAMAEHESKCIRAVFNAGRRFGHHPAPPAPIDLDELLSPQGAYEPGTGQEDGAQLLTDPHGGNPQWWRPLYGCDSLDNLLDRIRARILPHLRPPISGIDLPGPDGDYGGLQELCDAEGVDVRIGAPLLRRAREAWGNTVLSASPAEGEGEPSDEELLALMPQQFRNDLATVPREVLEAARIELNPAGKNGSLVLGFLERLSRSAVTPATVVAEGEVEKLARWLELEAVDVDRDDYTVIYDSTRLRRAADLLRQRHPAPPAEGEMKELVAKLRRLAPQNPLGIADPTITRAADLLEQRHPAPVPVAERLPGAEDCDAEGRCWLFSKVEKEWRLIDAGNPGVPHLKYCFSHWLPATALPLPSGEVEE